MVPRKPAEDRKSELVQVTLQLADTLGPDRLTTAVVARAVGVTQPAVFRHFPTKSALWLAVAEHVALTMAQAWETALADAVLPLTRIDRLVMAQLGLIEQYPALPAILFSRELSTENADLRAAFRGLLGRFQALLAAELDRGVAEGVVRADLRPDDGAVFLTALVQGLAIRWTMGAREFSLPAEGARLLAVQLALFRAARSEGQP